MCKIIRRAQTIKMSFLWHIWLLTSIIMNFLEIRLNLFAIVNFIENHALNKKNPGAKWDLFFIVHMVCENQPNQSYIKKNSPTGSTPLSDLHVKSISANFLLVGE